MTKRLVVTLFLLLATLGVWSSGAHADEVAGVEVSVRGPEGSDRGLYVAHVAPGAAVKIAPMVANGQIAEPSIDNLLKTSDSCPAKSVCANADYYFLDGTPSPGQPYGWAVIDGELWRTPSPGHVQLSLTPTGWTSDDVAVTTTLTMGLPAPHQLNVDAVNRDRQADQLTMFTPRFGPTTRTDGSGTEVVVKARIPLVLGQPVVLTPVQELVGGGDTAIPADSFVLSASGQAETALQQLWSDWQTFGSTAQVSVTATSSVPVIQGIGAHPVLLRDGQRLDEELDPADSKVSGRHARTLFAWNRATGDVWLIVVDGLPDGKAGVTLYEAIDVVVSLGATDAVNLDGGGSSTFVNTADCSQPACVINQPSDGVERQVAEVLTITSAVPERRINAATVQQAAAAVIWPDSITVPTTAAPRPPAVSSTTAAVVEAPKPSVTVVVEVAAPAPRHPQSPTKPVKVPLAVLGITVITLASWQLGRLRRLDPSTRGVA